MGGVGVEARLVAVDLPGHGRNGPPAEPPTLDDMADAIAAVLDGLDVERVVLVGHSNGGLVVRRFHVRHRERVSGLVLCDAALKPPLTPKMRAWMMSALERPDYAAFLDQMVAGVPRGGLSEEDFDVVRAAAASSRNAMLAWLEALGDEASFESAELDVPVLVVNSSAAPHSGEYVDLLSQIAPDARLHVFEGSGHLVMMECADEFNALLAEFLVD